MLHPPRPAQNPSPATELPPITGPLYLVLGVGETEGDTRRFYFTISAGKDRHGDAAPALPDPAPETPSTPAAMCEHEELAYLALIGDVAEGV